MIGYPTRYGYRGKMPNGTWRLFATEAEYAEAYYEESNAILRKYHLI